ncbi:MAG: restriction endonuclease subunit S [Magnetococcus sp. DMHC-1]|nr:restriction endonuclease subunit S [Magnetococcales bacterium]
MVMDMNKSPADHETSVNCPVGLDSPCVRPGYKQTEVGVIPEDWDAKKLGELASFRTGPFGSALHKSDYTNDGVPIVNPMHIVDSQILPTRTMTITESAATKLNEFRLNPGDVVIGRRGGMGRCAVVQHTHNGWLCGTGSMIVRPSAWVDAEFIQRVLSSPTIIFAIENTSVGSTMINLNQSTLRELVVQAPPLPEQRAIATALSDVDALLTKLEKLIAKKRDLKQAAMQQLLTGQMRLPGFGGEWEVKRLGDVGCFLKGSGIRKDESLSGDLPCVRYGEIYTKHSEYIKTFYSWISPQAAVTARQIKQGDLLFSGSGETKEEIGKCVAFVNDTEAYAGSDIVILRPEHSSPIFFGYYLNTAPINRQKASRGQGDAVVHISAMALADIEIKLPKFEEQTAIATVLFDMDAEITALESRRDKTRALKQGMMQELLTGRIRLI